MHKKKRKKKKWICESRRRMGKKEIEKDWDNEDKSEWEREKRRGKKQKLRFNFNSERKDDKRGEIISGREKREKQ